MSLSDDGVGLLAYESLSFSDDEFILGDGSSSLLNALASNDDDFDFDRMFMPQPPQPRSSLAQSAGSRVPGLSSPTSLKASGNTNDVTATAANNTTTTSTITTPQHAPRLPTATDDNAPYSEAAIRNDLVQKCTAVQAIAAQKALYNSIVELNTCTTMEELPSSTPQLLLTNGPRRKRKHYAYMKDLSARNAKRRKKNKAYRAQPHRGPGRGSGQNNKGSDAWALTATRLKVRFYPVQSSVVVVCALSYHSLSFCVCRRVTPVTSKSATSS